MGSLAEPLDDVRELNLVNNYRNCPGERTIVALADDHDIHIEFHRRPYGNGVFYAVRSDTPLAYCAGNITHSRRPRERFLISSTFVHADMRSRGIGRMLYLAIIDSGMTLVSDWELSKGAVALWQSLMASEPRGQVVHLGDGYFARRPRG